MPRLVQLLLPWLAGDATVPAPLPAPPAPAPPTEALPRGRDAGLEAECRMLLGALGDCEAIASRIEVHWNPRMKSTAGRAWSNRAKVELNPRLSQCPPGEIDRTLRHELAHLVAYHRAASLGRRRIEPHGGEWRRACADLGIPDEERTHRLDALQARQLERRFHYRCAHCGREYPRVRPIRRSLACGPCCQRLNSGRYDARFRLVPI